MGRFSENVRKQAKCLLKPVCEILIDELSKNEKDVKRKLEKIVAVKSKRTAHGGSGGVVRYEGFTEIDCRRLLQHVKNDKAKIRACAQSHQLRIACHGDGCLQGNLPNFKGKVLDVLIIAVPIKEKVWSWIGGDCKFGAKPGSYGLFASETGFRDDIDSKFENVDAHFRRVGETLLPQRLILVTTSAHAQCQRLYNSLKMGKEPHRITKGNYSLQTIATLPKFLKKQCRVGM